MLDLAKIHNLANHSIMVDSATEGKLQAYQNYTQALARLNSAQRRAVTSTEGPVMVVAGPGTGKTQILALRVAHIIHQGLANPEEVLCITFTNAGAEEMRQRIAKFIGQQANLAVFTFHGFCHYLVAEYAPYFATSHFRLWSDWEQLEFMRSFMRNCVELGHPLRRYYNIYSELANLQAHWQKMDMAREFFFPENSSSYADFLREFMQNLEQNPAFQYQRTRLGHYKQGEPRLELIKKKRATLQRTLAACELYPLFKAEQQRRQFKGFQDMINEVLDLLSSETAAAQELLKQLQERYQYILVDEFQDTNDEQYQIVRLLGSFWGSDSNIFIVGDRNQSIYAFQGTQEANLQIFRQDFITHSTQVIPLELNYRSTQSILDLAYTWLNDAQNPVLLAQKSSPVDASVVWQCYSRTKEDYLLTALQILRLSQSGVSFRDMAVLYPKHRTGDDLAKVLGIIGIPFQSRQSTDILTNPLIQYLLECLGYLHKLQAYRAANSPIDVRAEELNAELLRLLANWIKPQHLHQLWHLWENYALARLNDSSSTPISLLDYASMHASWHADFPIIPRLKSCLDLPLWHLPTQDLPAVNLSGETLSMVLEQVVELLALQEFLPVLRIRNPVFAEQALFSRHLDTLYEFVRSCVAENPGFGLAELLLRLKLYQQEKLPIEAIADPSMDSPNAVALLSLHASKGLEFEHVFLIGNHNSLWLSSRRIGYTLEPRDDSLPGVMDKAREEAERQRLLYVGITRAKSHLYVHYPCENSYIPVERLNQESVHLHQGSLAEPEYQACLAKYALQNLRLRPVLDSEKAAGGDNRWTLEAAKYLNPELTKNYLSRFALSYSALELYLSCPLKFYAKYVLSWPELAPEHPGAIELGRLMHELIHLVWTATCVRAAVPDYAQVSAMYAQLKMQTTLDSREVAEDIWTALQKRLPSLYHYLAKQAADYQCYGNLAHCLHSEQKYQTPPQASLQLKGYLDLHIKHSLVVDYKTQQNLDLRASLDNSLFRQAQFYRTLLSYATGHAPTSFIFAHILEEEVQELVLDFASHAALNAEYDQLLQHTYGKIQRGIFSFADNSQVLEGCGECNFCCLWQSEYS